MDLGHYSALAFLEQATSLWVKRLANEALFGGVVLQESTSSDPNAALGAGLVDPTAYTFTGDQCLLLYQADPGSWSDNYSVKIIPYSANPTLVKQEDTFAIQIFKNSNLNVALETHLCSRDPQALNGYNETSS